jgi:hypothetical protein
MAWRDFKPLAPGSEGHDEAPFAQDIAARERELALEDLPLEQVLAGDPRERARMAAWGWPGPRNGCSGDRGDWSSVRTTPPSLRGIPCRVNPGWGKSNTRW